MFRVPSLQAMVVVPPGQSLATNRENTSEADFRMNRCWTPLDDPPPLSVRLGLPEQDLAGGNLAKQALGQFWSDRRWGDWQRLTGE